MNPGGLRGRSSFIALEGPGLIMRKIFLVIFLLVSCTCANAEESDTITVLKLKWGTNPQSVGFKERGKGAEDQGPSSFFILNEQEAVILDSVNKKVKQYSNGKYIYSFDLFTKFKPYDVFIYKDFIYVLTNFSVEKYSKEGVHLQTKKLTDQPKNIKRGVWKIFLIDGDVVITNKPGRTNAQIFCLTESLQYKQCKKNIQSIFNKYEVIDMNKNDIVVDGKTKLISLNQNGNRLWTKEKPLRTTQKPAMFPIVTQYRFWNERLFTMEATSSGIEIYELLLNSDVQR